jgi:hypothetical protein
LSLADGVGQFLAGFLLQSWLVVKEIDLRGAPGLKQINHPLCLGRVVKSLARFGLEHVGEGDSAQTAPEAMEEASSVKPEGGFETRTGI